MLYNKPPLSFDEQADRFFSRGILADKPTLVTRLQAVNYYRLSAYLYPYRQAGSDIFISGTTLDEVWRHYTFDRQLRIMVMDRVGGLIGSVICFNGIPISRLRRWGFHIIGRIARYGDSPFYMKYRKPGKVLQRMV